jgi:hypothetical protein
VLAFTNAVGAVFDRNDRQPNTATGSEISPIKTPRLKTSTSPDSRKSRAARGLPRESSRARWER